MKFELGKLNNS